MKCANCDAEIKDGSIYCPVCGKEAQMVNGYSSLEDDFLHSLLREGLSPKGENNKTLTPEELQKRRKRKQRMPMLLTCFLLTFLILTGIVIKLFIDYKNDNSYDYQMKMAKTELTDHNYESALEYLARALSLDPEDIDSRLEMAEIYRLQGRDDAAIVLLSEVIRLNKNEIDAYQHLIEIYDAKKQYQQIKTLATYSSDEEVQKLFVDYIVEAPIIYPEGDTFYDLVEVTIFSAEKYAIYYTLDGSDPTEHGKRYIEGVGIELDSSGLYKIRGVCKNEKGIYSEIVEHHYQVVLTPKKDPLLPELPEETDEL